MVMPWSRSCSRGSASSLQLGSRREKVHCEVCVCVLLSALSKRVVCALSVGQPGAGDPLAFLRSMPQFAQFRTAIQRNPQMLQPLLQELGQSNPELLAVSGEGKGEGGWAAGVSSLHLIAVEKGTCLTVVCASEYLSSTSGRGGREEEGEGRRAVSAYEWQWRCPCLLQLISQNQERFLQIINEAPAESPQGQGQGQGQDPPGQGGAHYIPVTAQDRAAIDRVSPAITCPALVPCPLHSPSPTAEGHGVSRAPGGPGILCMREK